MINDNHLGNSEYLSRSVSENVSASCTAVSAAIESAQDLLSRGKETSAAQYEQFGRQMADLVADHSHRLSILAEGAGNAIEREALKDVSASLVNAIERLRAAGAEAPAEAFALAA